MPFIEGYCIPDEKEQALACLAHAEERIDILTQLLEGCRVYLGMQHDPTAEELVEVITKAIGPEAFDEE